MLELNKLYNMDCMQGMKEFPDGFFDLEIFDPPYGIGIDGQKKRVCGNPKHNRKEQDVYKRQLPDRWWWTATPDSPINSYVRRVYSDGSLSHLNAYYGYIGDVYKRQGTTLGTTTGQNLAAVAGGHSLAETVLLGALTLLWLRGTEHCMTPPFLRLSGGTVRSLAYSTAVRYSPPQ